jgi:hypothetical protein
VRIKHSFFDYGGEIDVCDVYSLGEQTARLSIRRSGDRYQLVVTTYGFPDAGKEISLAQGSLEEIVDTSNTLMKEKFGPDWEGDSIVPEDASRKNRAVWTEPY